MLDSHMQEFEAFVYNTNKNRIIKVEDNRFHVHNHVDLDFPWVINNTTKNASSDVLLLQGDDDYQFPERARICYEAIENGADVFSPSQLLCNEKEEVFYYRAQKPFDWEHHRTRTIGATLCFGAYRISTCPQWSPDINLLSDYAFVTECYLQNKKIVTSRLPLGLKTFIPGSRWHGKEDELAKEKELLKKRYGCEDMFTRRDSRPLRKFKNENTVHFTL